MLLLTSCASIYVVRHKTVASIRAEIDKGAEYRQRVKITGWMIDGFEMRAIYDSKEDLLNLTRGMSIRVKDGLPWDQGTDPLEEIKYPYRYKICQVTLEGTIYHTPSAIAHLYPELEGDTVELIDNIIIPKSKIEYHVFSRQKKQVTNDSSHDPFTN
jgi:hypothetical protein